MSEEKLVIENLSPFMGVLTAAEKQEILNCLDKFGKPMPVGALPFVRIETVLKAVLQDLRIEKSKYGAGGGGGGGGVSVSWPVAVGIGTISKTASGTNGGNIYGTNGGAGGSGGSNT